VGLVGFFKKKGNKKRKSSKSIGKTPTVITVDERKLSINTRNE